MPWQPTLGRCHFDDSHMAGNQNVDIYPYLYQQYDIRSQNFATWAGMQPCTRGRRPQRRAIVSGGPTPPLVRCWFQYKFQSVQLARLSPRFAQNTAYFRRFSLEKAVN